MPSLSDGARRQPEPEDSVAVRSLYRIAWRKMAANTGERTLIAAVIPPGSAHIDGVFAVGSAGDDLLRLVDTAAQLSTLTSDVLVRAAPKANIRATTIDRLPALPRHELAPEIRLRYLRLACISSAYADMWSRCFDTQYVDDSWTAQDGPITSLGSVEQVWNDRVPLRRAVDRRQATLEIDALVAISLGITADQLATIYRTQFPVLAGYDRSTYLYDAYGRQVPNVVLAAWRQKGAALSREERTTRHPGSGITYEYEPPFAARDRESDLRRAHSVFTEKFNRRANSA